MIQRVLAELSQDLTDVLVLEVAALLNLARQLLETALLNAVQVHDVHEHWLVAMLARLDHRLPDVAVAVLVYRRADRVIFVRVAYLSVGWAKPSIDQLIVMFKFDPTQF